MASSITTGLQVVQAQQKREKKQASKNKND
jgi:hypothetical protein